MRMPCPAVTSARPAQVEAEDGEQLVLDSEAQPGPGGHVGRDVQRDLGAEVGLEALLAEVGAKAAGDGHVHAVPAEAGARAHRPLVARHPHREGDQRLQQCPSPLLRLAARLHLALEVDSPAHQQAQRAPVIEPLLLLGAVREGGEDQAQREHRTAGRGHRRAPPPCAQVCAPAEGSPTASFSRPDRNGSRSSATKAKPRARSARLMRSRKAGSSKRCCSSAATSSRATSPW